MSDHYPPEQQPRMPGVKYRRVTLYRAETTEIDGIPETRQVPYDGWEPVPLVEWDDRILRGVTGLTIGITAIAVVATTASVGGLLSAMVPAVVAYAMGAVFTCTWGACLGLEWLNRINPQAAMPARVAGWFALAVSMGAVFAYGHTMGQPWAGGFGACIDLLSKGLWALLIRHHAVPLDPGVAHWFNQQEQKLATRTMLTKRMTRLNRSAAHLTAAGGAEFQAVGALLAGTRTTDSLPPAPAPDMSARPGPVSGQPSGLEPRPAPAAPAAPVVPAPVAASPVAPAPPPAPPVVPAPAAAPTVQAAVEPAAVVPTRLDASRPSIAALIRHETAQHRGISNEDLTELIRPTYPEKEDLADTVRRTRAREVKLGRAS